MAAASETRSASERKASATPYDALALVLVLTLTGVTVFSLVHPGVIFLVHSPPLENSIVTASLLAALGATYVALGEFLLYGRLSSLCVCLAFLLFVSDAAALGVVPLLTGWDRKLAWIPYGSAVYQVVGGGLLVAAGLLVDHNVQAGRRLRIAAEGIGVTAIFALAVAMSVYVAGGKSVSTSAQGIPQFVAGVLFFVASALFYRVSRAYRRSWFVWLALSLVIAAFAQLQFALHQYPIRDVQAGDILRLLFFTGILIWLAADWNQNFRRLRWQTRQLEALHQLMASPVIRNVPEAQAHIEHVVGEALGGQASLVIAGRGGAPLPEPLQAHMLDLGAHSASENGQEASQIIVGFDEDSENQVVVGVPLRMSARRRGLLVVRGRADRYTTNDLRLLRAFGDQASILLERSLLYEEVEAGAILQERSRLAREIHDGLAQHLAFLKMRVAWLQRGSAPVSAAQLKDIEGVLETALIEARHAITTLRAEPQGTSAEEALRRYLEEFGQVSGLTVQLEGDGTIPEVGPKTRVELLRVVQEALNNVRKHAQATRVGVSLAAEHGGAQITIRDDGVGFPADQDRQGHFGLDIMRERAESVGGTLNVTSSPGVGTEVRIWVPGQDVDDGLPGHNPLRVAQS